MNEQKVFILSISGIVSATIILFALIIGITTGVTNGNEQRAKSIQACVTHDGVWRGETGSCTAKN